MKKELRNLQDHQIRDVVREEDVPLENTEIGILWPSKVEADDKCKTSDIVQGW